MKIWILIALFNLFLLGTAVMGVKVLPVKPVLKTIQNLPKVVRTLKKVTKIPALSKDHKKILKNVLRIRDGIKPDSWEKIEKIIDFFKQVSKLLNQANISSSSVPMHQIHQDMNAIHLVNKLVPITVGAAESPTHHLITVVAK